MFSLQDEIKKAEEFFLSNVFPHLTTGKWTLTKKLEKSYIEEALKIYESDSEGQNLILDWQDFELDFNKTIASEIFLPEITISKKPTLTKFKKEAPFSFFLGDRALDSLSSHEKLRLLRIDMVFNFLYGNIENNKGIKFNPVSKKTQEPAKKSEIELF